MSNLLKQVAEPQGHSKPKNSFFCACGRTKKWYGNMCRTCKKVSIRSSVDPNEYLVGGVLCRRIPLTRKQYALVRSSDYEDLMKCFWVATWNKKIGGYYAVKYVYINGKSVMFYMHRILLNVTDGKVFVDHRNRDTLCNVRENLRRCTCRENNWNSKRRVDNASGYIGVYLPRDRSKWIARIEREGRTIRIGSYDTPEEAARARDAQAIALHGEFAVLNFPIHFELSSPSQSL